MEESHDFCVQFTLPFELRSFFCHFQSRWIAFDANAKTALPEFVYINLDIWSNHIESKSETVSSKLIQLKHIETAAFKLCGKGKEQGYNSVEST